MLIKILKCKLVHEVISAFFVSRSFGKISIAYKIIYVGAAIVFRIVYKANRVYQGIHFLSQNIYYNLFFRYLFCISRFYYRTFRLFLLLFFTHRPIRLIKTTIYDRNPIKNRYNEKTANFDYIYWKASM